MQTVHLRVLDAATGRPTPVRLRLTDAAGQYRAPLGRLAEFATAPGKDLGGQVRRGGRASAYIDGACEVRLPPGRITVEITKGPEYTPIVREVALAAGQLALRFQVERCAPVPQEAGWWPADLRAHEMPPEAAALEGAAEGLALVHLLARERPPRGDRPGAIPNLLAFTGDRDVNDGPCAVSVNTLNVHPDLGTVGLLNCHRVVYPLRSGEPESQDFWSVADWCDQCHRKKGLVTWPDLYPRVTPDSPQAEALAALILGKIDAFEVTRADSLYLYHQLLDCGLRPALVGASGKDSNAQLLGAVRTYIQADAPTLPAWTEAIRAGRTCATSGPRLTLGVNGQGPGARITAGPGDRLHVVAEGSGDRLEVIAGGTVVESASMRMETAMVCEQSTWLAARHCGADGTFAHTTPVFVDVPGRPASPSRETLAPLLAALDAGLAYADRSRFSNERYRAHLRDCLTGAKARLTTPRKEAP